MTCPYYACEKFDTKKSRNGTFTVKAMFVNVYTH